MHRFPPGAPDVFASQRSIREYCPDGLRVFYSPTEETLLLQKVLLSRASFSAIQAPTFMKQFTMTASMFDTPIY